MIYLDFETRSKCDLRKAGAWKYSLDPSTQVLCMAWAVDDGPVQILHSGFDFMQQDFEDYLEQGHMFEAHNAFFEKSIYRNILVKKYGWPEIPDDRWSCSASLCAAHSIPRKLEDACKALDLSVQKNMDGHRIMMKMVKPRKHTKNDKRDWHDNPEDYQKLYEYCMDDVRAERALSKTLRPLSKDERGVWLLDQEMNMRGVRVDVGAAQAAVSVVTEYTQEKISSLPDITDGLVRTSGQIQKIKDFCADHGYPMEGLAADLVEKALKDDLPNCVREVLEIRSLTSKSSVKKYQALLDAEYEGRMHDLLMYHGAGPGRWTGKKFQPQNLPRGNFKGNVENYFSILKQNDPELFELCYEDVLGTVSSNIRGCIIPSEGKDLFCGDYSAIEARGVLWLAGDNRALDIFKRGKDIYVDLAQTIYQKEDISVEERFLGKQGILGCGYQMGWERFIGTCAQYGVTIDEETARRVVTAYRRKFIKVKHLWGSQDAAVREAITTGRFVKADGIGWGVHGKFLYCKLPSGRCIAYCDPKIKTKETKFGIKDVITYMSVDSQTKKWVETDTYGGKIVENVTQAMCRDLMVYGMFAIKNAGYYLLLTVHDEIMAENDKGDVKEFEKLMGTTPDWAKGLPVKVEAWKGKRYRK